jgi:hypothetical protein
MTFDLGQLKYFITYYNIIVNKILKSNIIPIDRAVHSAAGAAASPCRRDNLTNFIM